MVDENLHYKHFCLQHQLTNQVRIITPVLIEDPELSYILERLLKKRPEITQVSSLFANGSVTIDFDATRLPKKNLLILLDAVLGNIGKKTHPVTTPLKKEFHGALQEIDLAIEGMSCQSCALLIEIALNRDERVKTVSVNYAAKAISVCGDLSKLEVIAIIASLGYKALLIDNKSQRKKPIQKEQLQIDAARRQFGWAGLVTRAMVALTAAFGGSRKAQPDDSRRRNGFKLNFRYR